MPASSQEASSSGSVSVSTLTKPQRKKLQTLSKSHERHHTIGVCNMLTTVTIAVRFPAYFWIWHLIRTSFYIPLRYLRFRKQKWELYLLDWCYVVTYLSNICAILAFVRVTTGLETPLTTHNANLIHAGFAMAGGPLAWSICIFRNSLVFHDVDHTTSVFIHLSPFTLFWCLRWGSGLPSIINSTFPGLFRVCESEQEFAAADACFESLKGMLWCNACEAPFSAFVVAPSLIYLVWSSTYFVLFFVLLRNWCKRTKRETLYTYFCDCNPDLVAVMERKLSRFVGIDLAGPLGYTLLHLSSTTLMGATSYVLWHSFVLHTLFFAFLLVSAVSNGSSYMFRIFAYRYAQEQLDKHKKIVLGE